jgi:hypothetical protein
MSRAGRLIAFLGCFLFAAAALAAEPGTVKGKLTYDGKVYELAHVFVWQPPFQDQEMWIYLTDRPLPQAAATAQDGEELEDLARQDQFGGIKIVVDPVSPRIDDFSGIVYAPRGDMFSLDQFNFGPSWEAFAIEGRRAAGKAATKWMNWTLQVEFSAPVEGSTGKVEIIKDAEARKSPQADVFVAFEQALVEQGIDAAGAFMTPERLAAMKATMQRLGEASFKEFQAQRKASRPLGEARRQQIERVDVDGDLAEIGARTGPDSLDTALLIKTKDGWKIAEW